MYTGTECKGKSYKFSEVVIPGHTDPRTVYETDREARKRWFNVHDKATIFDFGAEYGHWTLAAITQGARMVYSFESDHEYLKAFKNNLYTNNFAERCMPVRPEENFAPSLDAFIEKLSYPPESIQFIRLSESYSAPDVLAQLLKGAQSTITDYKPQLIVTFDQNKTLADFQKLIDGVKQPYSSQLLDVMYRKYIKIMFS